MIDVRELERQAVNEPVSLAPYDPAWPRQFDVERARLAELAPEFLAIEHIGSTAIPGLAAKPIIDIIAAVPSMEVADVLVERLCANGYITSADFNRSLGHRRWVMRQSAGKRTHHLHLVLEGSSNWSETICFREVLLQNDHVAKEYAKLKQSLVSTFSGDREGYTAAKTAFIANAVRMTRRPSAAVDRTGGNR